MSLKIFYLSQKQEPLLFQLLLSGLRNIIIIELGIGFNIAFSNSIGIGIEIGIEKKSRPVLLLVLVLQFTLSQYWYSNMLLENTLS